MQVRALVSLAAVLTLEACAVVPPPSPPPRPRKSQSWDVTFPPDDEQVVLGVGKLRFRFTRLQPVTPIGGLERGEDNLGFGVDLLGIGVGLGDDAPRPEERVEQEDAEPRAFSELDHDLDRAIERVHEAAKRAQEQEPGPAP